MTAPGDSVVIIVLVAVFVACSGYAAGRLHQRYQLERDREEAYRDGYDTATRSVFSLAARVIAPRRAARGAASAPRVAPAPRVASDPRVVPDPLVVPGASGAPDPLVRPDASDLRIVPGASDSPVVPAASGAAPALPIAPPPAPTGSPGGPAVVPGMPAPVSGLPGGPGSSGGADGPGDSGEATQLGFPVPPQSSPRVIAEPAAVGGVVYQPFPDPRPDAAETAPAATEGRHTVPDELVQANTYRLPPDRIFRARVPDATNAPGLPEEPTTRISSVPKPRQS
jgi:hypothetical protein